MPIHFKIKQGDTIPTIRVTCRDNVGVIDLTAATSVTFSMVNVDTGIVKVLAAAATFVNKPGGVIEYRFVAANVDTVGNYRAEFEVTFPEGKETFPSDSYIYIEVVDDLA